MISSLNQAMLSYFSRHQVRTAEDSWQPQHFTDKPDELNTLKQEMLQLGFKKFDMAHVKDDKVLLSNCTTSFAKNVVAYFDDCARLYTQEVHNVFVQCLIELFKTQSIQLEIVLKDAQFRDKISFVMLNAEFVFGPLFEVVNERLTTILGHESALLQVAKQEMGRLRGLGTRVV